MDSFGQKLIPFIVKHWWLVAAFVIVLVWLFVEEFRAKAGGSTVTPQKLTNLVNRQNAVVLDIRENSVFQSGHIVNSVNIPQKNFGQQNSKLEKYKQRDVIVVCNKGNSAVSAAKELRKAGFSNVHVLQGGINAWVSAGMPTVKGK